MTNPWEEILHPITGQKPDSPLQGVGFFLASLSSFGVKIDVDKMTVQAWAAEVGRFEPSLVVRAVQSFAKDPDRAHFQQPLPWVSAWLVSAAPPPPQCTKHIGQREGHCGECRAERLIAGVEKPIGRSTVPQLRGGTPIPEHLKPVLKQIGARP